MDPLHSLLTLLAWPFMIGAGALSVTGAYLAMFTRDRVNGKRWLGATIVFLITLGYLIYF